MYACDYWGIYACEYSCLEDRVGCPRAGVTSNYELPNAGVGNPLISFTRAKNALE